jgi:5-methylcytosine-specific restriction enzyme A
MASRRSSPLPKHWKQLRSRVMRLHMGVCHVCLQPGSDEVDHIVPVIRGGSDDLSNLAPIHKQPCHEQKTAREARGEPRRRSEELHPGFVLADRVAMRTGQ